MVVVVAVVGGVVVVILRNRSSAIRRRKSLADETAPIPIMVEIILSMLLPAVTTPKKANNKPAVDMMSAWASDNSRLSILIMFDNDAIVQKEAKEQVK